MKNSSFVKKITQLFVFDKACARLMIFAIIMIVGVCVVNGIKEDKLCDGAKSTLSGTKDTIDAQNIVIVVDAGHGGKDPGKVGIDGKLEKDYNLSISGFLKDELLRQGMSVIMTREKDTDLSNNADSKRKAADLRNRVDLIEKSSATVAISIHQNSFTNEAIHGAQTFYYKESQDSKLLAEYVQKRLCNLDDTNKRQIKANNSYYLLKKSFVPTIIVECGFLSNKEEANKLSDVDYQKKLACGISDGLIEYLNENILN